MQAEELFNKVLQKRGTSVDITFWTIMINGYGIVFQLFRLIDFSLIHRAHFARDESGGVF